MGPVSDVAAVACEDKGLDFPSVEPAALTRRKKKKTAVQFLESRTTSGQKRACRELTPESGILVHAQEEIEKRVAKAISISGKSDLSKRKN